MEHQDRPDQPEGHWRPRHPALSDAELSRDGITYFQGLKTIWRGAKPANVPPPNIAVYGSTDASVDKPHPIDYDATVGVNFTGLIPGRPFDALGLQAKHQRLSQAEANSETAKTQILTRKREARQQCDGFAFKAIAVRPLVQYFINPDNCYPSLSRVGGPRSGFEVGFSRWHPSAGCSAQATSRSETAAPGQVAKAA